MSYHGIQSLEETENKTGKALGTGLADALQTLAQHKMKALQTKHDVHGLIKSGLTPEQAQAIATSSPDIRKAQLSGLGTWSPLQQNQEGAQNPVAQQQGQSPTSQWNPKPNYQEQRNQIAQEKLNLQKHESVVKQEERDYNRSLPAYEDALSKYRKAEQTEAIIDRQLDLIDKGEVQFGTSNIPASVASYFTNLTGFPVPENWTKNTATQYYEKNTAALELAMAEASKFSRPTEEMRKNIKKAVSDSSNSPEAARLVLETGRDIQQLEKLDKILQDKIITANNGTRPANLAQLTEQRAAPVRELMYEKWKDAYSDKVSQNSIPHVSNITEAKNQKLPKFIDPRIKVLYTLQSDGKYKLTSVKDIK